MPRSGKTPNPKQSRSTNKVRRPPAKKKKEDEEQRPVSPTHEAEGLEPPPIDSTLIPEGIRNSTECVEPNTSTHYRTLKRKHEKSGSKEISSSHKSCTLRRSAKAKKSRVPISLFPLEEEEDDDYSSFIDDKSDQDDESEVDRQARYMEQRAEKIRKRQVTMEEHFHNILVEPKRQDTSNVHTNIYIGPRSGGIFDYATATAKEIMAGTTSKSVLVLRLITSCVIQRKKPADLVNPVLIGLLFDRPIDTLHTWPQTAICPRADQQAQAAELPEVHEHFFQVINGDVPLIALKCLRYAGYHTNKDLEAPTTIIVPTADMVASYVKWRVETSPDAKRSLVDCLRLTFRTGSPVVVNAAARLVGRGFTSFSIISSLARECTSDRASMLWFNLMMTHSREFEAFLKVVRWLDDDPSRFAYAFYDTIPSDKASRMYRTLTTYCARVIDKHTLMGYGVKFHEVPIPEGAQSIINQLKEELSPKFTLHMDQNTHDSFQKFLDALIAFNDILRRLMEPPL